MNPEIENQVSVAEQVEEIEQTDEAIKYILSADGTISAGEMGIESPESGA